MKKKIIFITLFGLICAIFPSNVHAQVINHLGVRAVNGDGEFYDTVTNQKFTPRGMDYIILGKYPKPNGTCAPIYHSNFVPPNNCSNFYYKASEQEAALAKMEKDGYNTVRVFINESAVGSKNGGLDSAYMANVADFLKRANKHHIYVDFVFEWLPGQGGYGVDSTANITGTSAFYLTESGISARIKYITDFINSLKSANAPLNAIFGYSINNEQAFNLSTKPLNASAGAPITVKTADGKTYTLPGDNLTMMDNNTVNYINEVRSGVRLADSGALVGIGFLQPGAVPGLQTVTKGAIARSTADFIDIHVYNFSGSMQAVVNAYEISSNKKPFLMGEFGWGINKDDDAGTASVFVKKIQTDSCKTYAVSTANNFQFAGFDGWLFWTWNDTVQVDDKGKRVLWNALDGGEAINNALKPVNRWDPCNSNNTTPPPSSKPTSAPPTVLRGDFNGDKHIDYKDYLDVTANFGNPYSIFNYNNLIANYGK